MTDRKEPTGQEKRIYNNCRKINQILWNMSVEGHRYASSFGKWKDTGQIQIIIDEHHPTSQRDIGDEFWHSKGGGKTLFNAAYEGLPGEKRKELGDLTTRALSVAVAVRDDEIKLRIGETKQVDADSPLARWYRDIVARDNPPFFANNLESATKQLQRGYSVRLDVMGVEHRDLVLFTPTFDPHTGRYLDDGRLYLNFWGDGVDINSGYSCLDAGSAEILAREDHFLMLAESSKEAKQKATYFKQWVKRIAIPQGSPVTGEIGSLLSEGYHVTRKKYEAVRKKRKATKTARELGDLEGTKI